MPSSRKETASQLKSKHVLAVRALVARVSWLDWKLYQQDGRVVCVDRLYWVLLAGEAAASLSLIDLALASSFSAAAT